MKSRMKRIAALLLAGMMTVSLAACGGNSEEASSKTDSKDGKVTLKDRKSVV